MFTALLISVPGEVFVRDVTTGRVKGGEKVLLTRWYAVEEDMPGFSSCCSYLLFSHISCEVSQLREIIVLASALRALNLAGVKEPKSILSSGQSVLLEEQAPDTPASSLCCSNTSSWTLFFEKFSFFFPFFNLL